MRRFTFVAALGLIAASAAFPQSGGLELGGSLAVDTSILQSFDGSGQDLSLGGSSQLTLNFVNSNRQSAKVEGSVILTLLTGAYADAYSAALVQTLGSGVAPALITILSSSGAIVNVDLRKLYLEIYSPVVDISMGRQIVNFGKGTLFSPIDAFSRPLLSDLNYVRTGSDVVRLEVSFGEVSGLEAVSTIADSVSRLSSALKLYTIIADFDLSAVGLYQGAGNQLLAGLDFKGDLLVGIYGEAVEHFLFSPSSGYFEGMLGADYSIEGALFFILEYYYNGNPVAPGSLGPADLAAQPGIFLNQQYLSFSSRWLVSDLVSVMASVIYDIPASAFLPTLQLDFNAAQNADLLFYARYFHGDIRGGGAAPGPDLQYGVQVSVRY